MRRTLTTTRRGNLLASADPTARRSARRGQSTPPALSERRERAESGHYALSGHSLSPERAQTLTPLLRPAPAVLTLPHFSKEIPTGFTVDGQDFVFLLIAEGLLAEGMLQEEDWDKELGLAGSVIRGLRQWTLENLPDSLEEGCPFSYFAVEIGLTDRCRTWGVSPLHDIGGIGLLKEDAASHAIIGAHIEALEEWQKGAGYSVYQVLVRSIGMTVGGATPNWAHATAKWWWENADTEEREESGEIDPKEFAKAFPKAILKPRWNANAMKKADSRRIGLARDDWMGDAIWTALELRKAIALWESEEKAKTCRGDDSIGCYEFDYVPPILVQYTKGDDTLRVFDDVSEMAWQTDTSNCCWLGQFFTPDAEGIRQAARGLKHCLKVLTLADNLLLLLDETATESERVRIRL